ncbi:hypothetical protein L596_026266 [Steinernema carpocapsae]|uniref:Uncharacterized protein n=1 Tax=Steinernema carpocapsae TaxID=34508 RepID=A0A4U5M0U5_STECR|nr:hypothetical protein L596_026266 [Steinernema carpocapsae]
MAQVPLLDDFNVLFFCTVFYIDLCRVTLVLRRSLSFTIPSCTSFRPFRLVYLDFLLLGSHNRKIHVFFTLIGAPSIVRPFRDVILLRFHLLSQ